MKPSIRRRSLSRRTLGGSGALLAAATFATFVAPATGSDEPPVFPSQIEMVTVDAVIVDSNGEPVPGLTREDFKVLEGGVRQEIATFEAISVQPPPDAAPSVGSPRPVRVATNVTSPSQRATFLVVIDDMHLSAATLTQARIAAERFLHDAARAGDHVTIVSTATRNAWSGTLPEELDDLLAFIRGLKGRIVTAGPELMSEYEAMRIVEYDDREVIERVMGRYYAQMECETLSPCDAKVVGAARALHGPAKGQREGSLTVLERSLEGLSRLRGRKSAILLSEGFVHDDPQEQAYARAVAAAQRANAAVYFVDARGVVGASPYTTADMRSAGEPANPKLTDKVTGVTMRKTPDMKELLHRSFQQQSRSDLKIGVETMADDTGGFAVRGTNDLAPGLARIAAESRSYYLLGYYPKNTTRDGTFRKIELDVARPGLTVRARKGYEAPLPEGKARRARRDEKPDPLVQAFEAAADVPLRLATYALEPVADGRTRVLAVTEIDVSGLRAEEKAGRRVGHLELRLEAIPRDGGETRAHDIAMDADVPAVASSPAPGVWRPIRLEFELPRGVYRVRASVRDASSGASGIVAQRLVVADPAAFRISTPILSDVVGAPTGASTARDPAPLARQQFAAGSGRPLLCQFEVFGAAKRPETKRTDVTVQLTLTDAEGRAIGASAPVPMAQSRDGRLRQLIALPLERLAAGRYALRLVVADRVAGANDAWQDDFAVEAPPAATGERTSIRMP